MVAETGGGLGGRVRLGQRGRRREAVEAFPERGLRPRRTGESRWGAGWVRVAFGGDGLGHPRGHGAGPMLGGQVLMRSALQAFREEGAGYGCPSVRGE